MNKNGLLLGYDIGSSSIKATLFDPEDGTAVVSTISPAVEMPIIAKKPGWAEQEPRIWWEHVVKATARIKAAGGNLKEVKAIGISYQMHGLVLVDKQLNVLRPSIIWCDSRAVTFGEKVFKKIGPEKCLSHMLNSPGNFTASKLAWVRENEPGIYKQIHKIMLPGDFIAMKMTGAVTTTVSGLSEGILWDFSAQKPASIILDAFGFPPDIIPDTTGTFAVQGRLTKAAAEEMGVPSGTPVAYRAGDQPNNALSLNVLTPGEIAATAGTSGVIYGVGDTTNHDRQSRVNTFVHVNHSPAAPRYGTLLCINGTGILNSWMRQNVSGGLGYEQMNLMAERVPAGSDGLVVLPFGNGIERTLGNRNPGASFHGLSFTTHTKAHMFRAAQEGIVFALNYGLQIMRDIGLRVTIVRAGNANMFLSPLFGSAFATVTGAVVQLYSTDGAQGAARGAGIGAGIYKGFDEAFSMLKTIRTIEPSKTDKDAYAKAYRKWTGVLSALMNDG